MAVSALVRAESARHDWKSLACMCGDSAEHVPLLFETVITAETPRDMIGYTLDGHVEGDTNITECTAPAVGVIMAPWQVSTTGRRRRHGGRHLRVPRSGRREVDPLPSPAA
ncbi:hypothetical protein MBT84_41140 [Streptomyces sp. MBT84]|nr:hypothetical protein [Streptomyces sp. MBT84]